MEQANGTSTSNNTRLDVHSKKRNYFVTFWIHDYPKSLPKGCKYLVTCEDLTKDNQYHGHAFIYFNNPRSMSAIKKLFGNDCHLKKIFNNSGCIKYVKGEIGDERKVKTNILEHGSIPNDNGCHTIGELKKMSLDDVPPQYYNVWQKLQPTKIKKSEWSKKVEVHYICGPSGIGKSNLAAELADDEFDEVKFVNGFWSPCSGTGCCIYDDFRSSHMTASEFINFIDYRSHNLNVKGGTVRNNYTKIIITSIQTIDELYSNMPSEAKQQWIRRMIVHNLYPESIDLV